MSSPYPPEDFENPLGAEETLTLRPFKFEEEDDARGTGRISLNMWCFNKQSDSILVRIDNFRVYCCIELPTNRLVQHMPPDGDIKKAVYKEGSTIIWDNELAKRVYQSICYKQERSTYGGRGPKECPFDWFFGYFTDIYYYTGRKKPYLYLYFNTIKGRNDLNNALRYPINIPGEGYVQLTMHENKISTFRRLMSKRDIKYAQWFSINARKVPVNSHHRISKSYCIEYIANYETINGIPEIETSKWFVYPKLFAWDIETYSKNHRQMPVHSRRSDCIYVISVVFQFLEQNDTRRKYCLVFGNCNPVTDAEIIRFPTEKEMLFGFCAMFDYLDPDFVTGYNTDAYDWPYLIGRFERLEVPIEDIPNTGRMIHDKTSVFSTSWSSSGAGKNNITFIKQKGRDPLDMLKNIKRIYKFRKYTLEYVSQYFLNEGKHDIKAKEMFVIYEKSIAPEAGEEEVKAMTDVVKYCIQDSILPIKLIDKTKIWYHLSSLSNVAGVPIIDLFTRGEQIRCYSNIAHECYKQKMVLSNPKFYDYYYKGGFVAKPNPGVYKYVFTLDFTSLYPSIMQAYNLSPDTFIPILEWPNVPEHLCEIIEFDQEEPRAKLSGSYRQDLEDKYRLYVKFQYDAQLAAREGREYKPPCTLKLSQDDVNNLIMLGNSEIKSFTFNPENATEDINLEPDDLTQTDTVMRHYEFRFIKKEYKVTRVDENGKEYVETVKIHEGIMPLLERNWVASRKAVKRLMKACEDLLENGYDQIVDGERIVHNAHQNCIKIVANSGYGFCGVQKGMLPCVFVAICVTALGRRLIGMANDKLVEKFAHLGAKVVYNDTDSSMVAVDLNGDEDLEAIGHEMEAVINGRKEKVLTDGTVIPAIEPLFKDPLKMEWENCCQMCPLKPKYYLKLLRNTKKSDIAEKGEFKKDHKGKYEIVQKGVLTSKKGNSTFANVVYQDLSDRVLFKKHTIEQLKSLCVYVSNLLNDKFSARELCRVTAVGDGYTNESYYMAVFVNYLASKGMPVQAGERLEYIIVRTHEEMRTGVDAKVGEKCREISMWEEDENRESIDYVYYIEKGLQEQYDYLFYVGNMNIVDDPRLAGAGYQPQFSRCQFVHFKYPIKMIAALIKDYMKLNDQEFAQHMYVFCYNYAIQYDPALPRNRYLALLVDHFISKLCYIINQLYPMESI